jgi:hypothetical protein
MTRIPKWKDQDIKLETSLMSKGFKKKWLGDKSGYWLEYAFKGPFNLKGKLIVDTSFQHLTIELENKSNKLANFADSKYVDLNYKYSPESIKRVLKEVKKVNNARWMTK